jgi:tetratricopeptide (TPR) repeat protein
LRARKALTVVALCCCLQAFLVGLIGVVRGYSVQGFWSSRIALAGVFCLIFLALAQKHGKNVPYYISISVLMYSSLAGLPQGRHLRIGRQYYEQGRYRRALQEFKRETQTWYLRLRYNLDEHIATEMMAKTFCQLEDFDKARQTYELIMYRYPGLYADRAEKYLDRLEAGLKFVAKYESWVSGEKDFPYYLHEQLLKAPDSQLERTQTNILNRVATIYEYDLRCNAKAVEAYRKIAHMDTDEQSKQRARKQIAELTVHTQK